MLKRSVPALAGWAAVLLVPAFASAETRRERPPAPTASAPAPSAPAASAPAPAAASAPAPTRRGLDPVRAAGRVKLTLSLPGKLRLGGFSLTATYDPDKLIVSEPDQAEAMQGYMCQSNLAQPGLIRFNCAGLVGEDRGGLLATFPVAHAGAAPTAADVVIGEFEIVDDHARKIEGVRPVLAVEPIAR
jgi:hypothetical protein